MIRGLFLAALAVGTSSAASAAASSSNSNDAPIYLDKDSDRCTTMVVGRLAGKYGPMNTHTADCADCDFRINKVPPRDWPAGTQRPLYVYRTAYPATVTSIRGDTWHPDNLEGSEEQKALWGKESTVEGHIPEASHTYGLFEAGYGIMNEHQVAIGESTCQAKFYGVPVSAGGKAHIEAREMTHVALERATSAREAISIMGELAVSLGFYAADWSGGDLSKGEGGEALTVVDKTEAWVFHVLGDDTGASAVWAAQRVPDNHISVVANQFVIRHIKRDSDDFMYSPNMYDVAKRNNLWNEAMGDLDFTRTFAPPRAHSPYATRRVWRVFNLAAPSIVLNPFTNEFADDYPFSVPVDQVLSPQDLMRFQRDHYEGTQFDLTQGLASGPFGWPDRYDGAANGDMDQKTVMSGGFERAISLFRTSYSFVSVPRADMPDALALMWFAPYAPSSGAYAPFYVAAKNPPKSYMHGSLFKFDPSSTFWAFSVLANYASHMYKFVFADIKAVRAVLEDDLQKQVDTFEASLLPVLKAAEASSSASTKTATSKKVVEQLTEFTWRQGDRILKTWQELFPQMVTKFHDGYTALDLNAERINMKRNGYPEWWLRLVGFFDGTNAPNVGPDVIQFQPTPDTISSYVPLNTHRIYILASSLLTGLVCLVAGMMVSKRFVANAAASAVSVTSNRGAYTRIGEVEL